MRQEALKLGLALNPSKCEVICPLIDRPTTSELLSQFKWISPELASLLGVPLSTGQALTDALSQACSSLELMSDRLARLHAQDALLVLRHSFSVPRIQHLLRGIFCGEHSLLASYDACLRASLSRIINTYIDDQCWAQASLPINSGGLGICSAVAVSAPAFLSSMHGADALSACILRKASLLPHDVLVTRATEFWSKLSGASVYSAPTGSLVLQKTWDSPIVASVFQNLLDTADIRTKARLMAVASSHAGDWLKALPSSSLGLRLDDEGVRICVGLRLGSSICTPYTCLCGAPVDSRGTHSLSCSRSAGRQPRHALVNDIMLRAFGRAGIPTIREPAGLALSSSLRPDGTTIIPWSQGKCLAWDVTCPDTLATSNVTGCAREAGSAAERAAQLKHSKYQQLQSTHDFAPIALETLGPINKEGLSLLNALGGRIIAKVGNLRERMFLFQRLSMAVQRGNIASFVGSLKHEKYFHEM